MHTPNPPQLSSARKRLHQHGFTLIELLVTLSIAGVLAALAAPSFQNAIASSRVKARTTDLIGALSTARSEAIRRGKRITVCKSSDQANCATTGDWTQGWITFEDVKRDTGTKVDSVDTVISVGQDISKGVVIVGATDVASYVSFAADGRSKTIGGASLEGEIRICSNSTSLSNDKRSRDVKVTAVGRIVASTPTAIANTCPAP